LQVTFLPLSTLVGHLTFSFPAFELVAPPAAIATALTPSTATSAGSSARRSGIDKLRIIPSFGFWFRRDPYP
jgi:hypothetical protein